MTKLILLSDTHGNRKGIDGLEPLIAENDLVVHLGDGAADMREIARRYPDKVYQCAGNCDLFSPYPQEGVLEVEYLKIFYCHGHRYGVKRELTELAQEAKARGCEIALYGHTHTPLVSVVDGVTLINPGSLRLPADVGGTYCYLVVHKREFTPTIVGKEMR